MKELSCPICRDLATSIGNTMVRQEYPASFYQCVSCGYAFANNPTWLAEAYKNPINKSDVGYVSRNIRLSNQLACLIRFLRLEAQSMLDFGAGYGLFVRMMRDKGFDFYWEDKFCSNLFALGFEAENSERDLFSLVTAFEVLEHSLDPRALLKQLRRKAKNIIFSTTLIPFPAPPLESWWYYGLDHGQHISFLSQKALELLSKELGLSFQSDGVSLHYIGERPISRVTLKSTKFLAVQKISEIVLPRKSLRLTDFDRIRQDVQNKNV
jgi:hypothetical protein